MQSTAQAHCTSNDYWGQLYYRHWQYYAHWHGSWPFHDRQQPLGHGTLPAHVRQWNHAWPGAQSSHTQPLPSARNTARPPTTGDASTYSSDYESSESESEESRAPQETSQRADVTNNNTEAMEETNESVLQVVIVNMSSYEHTDTMHARLKEACSVDVDILIVTLDRTRQQQIDGTDISADTFRQCLDVEETRSLKSAICSDNRSTNIAVYWNSQRCDCTGFQQVPITGTTQPAPSAFYFQLQAPQWQETIDCAVMQVEIKEDAVLSIQSMWSRLKYPCMIAGNLLVPNGYLHAWMKPDKEEKEKNEFQMVDHENSTWPTPSMFAALAQVHVKPIAQTTQAEKPPASTLAVHLRGGNVKLQDPTLIPEKKREPDEPLLDDSMPEEKKSQCMQNIAALAVKTMAHCHPESQPPSEEDQQNIRKAADEAAHSIITSDPQQDEKLRHINDIAIHLMFDGLGQPRDLRGPFSWWQFCDRAKQTVETESSREYREPIEDTCVKCNVRLARQMLKDQGYQDFVRMVTESRNGSNQITVSWRNEEQRRRFRTGLRDKLGHKDMFYYIWKKGLPNCFEKHIDAADDYERYTKQLVQWYWDIANEIIGTIQQNAEMSLELKRRWRENDNAGILRRLRCRVD